MAIGVAAAAVGAGINLIGGLAGNRAAAKQARLNREFQDRLSRTAHQREVKDLRLAGLNPILSAGGQGASTPTGATAQQQNPAAGVSTSAKELGLLSAQMENVKADTANKQATKLNTDSDTYLKYQQGDINAPNVQMSKIDLDYYRSTFGTGARWWEKGGNAVMNPISKIPGVFRPGANITKNFTNNSKKNFNYNRRR